MRLRMGTRMHGNVRIKASVEFGRVLKAGVEEDQQSYRSAGQFESRKPTCIK